MNMQQPRTEENIEQVILKVSSNGIYQNHIVNTARQLAQKRPSIIGFLDDANSVIKCYEAIRASNANKKYLYIVGHEYSSTLGGYSAGQLLGQLYPALMPSFVDVGLVNCHKQDTEQNSAFADQFAKTLTSIKRCKELHYYQVPVSSNYRLGFFTRNEAADNLQGAQATYCLNKDVSNSKDAIRTPQTGKWGQPWTIMEVATPCYG
ncbi:MAG: hypothetical protein KAT71_03620 [Gammaproteobacteria bacterium]|nr:hypothetical protein [Gammaproteobacteria bacterium]